MRYFHTTFLRDLGNTAIKAYANDSDYNCLSFELP